MAKAFSDEALAVGRALEAAYPADQRAAALLRERPAPKGGLFMGLPELVVLLNFRPRDVALHSGEELLGYMLAAWPSYAANKDFADRGRGPSEATLLTFAIQTGDEALVRRAIALRDPLQLRRQLETRAKEVGLTSKTSRVYFEACELLELLDAEGSGSQRSKVRSRLGAAESDASRQWRLLLTPCWLPSVAAAEPHVTGLLRRAERRSVEELMPRATPPPPASGPQRSRLDRLKAARSIGVGALGGRAKGRERGRRASRGTRARSWKSWSCTLL